MLLDEQRGIIAGHGRVEAAKLLGLETVPTVCLRDMSEADVRAYVIADNKLAENAGWDRNLLALQFQYLSELELNFDLTITGFELPEIDIALGRPAKQTQFKKGQSGNPKGRPKKRSKTEFDLGEIIDRSMMVKVDGEPRTMQPKEVELRQLVERALKKQDLAAIDYLLDLFRKYGAIEPPQERPRNGVVELPRNVPWRVATAAFEKLGHPTWKDRDLAPIKVEYLKTRREIDRIQDEIRGYDL